MRKIITSYLLFFSFLSVCSAQKESLPFNTITLMESSDSNTVAPPKVLKQKSPLKASLLSTFIPGSWSSLQR